MRLIPLLLASLALTAVAPTPVALVPVALAQAQPSVAQVVEMRSEQAAPRKPVPFDPKNFDKFVGAYHLYPDTVVWVTRDGSHYLVRLTGRQTIEVFPESQTKFFSSEIPLQYSFDTDTSGRVGGLVLHQSGMEQGAARISAEAAKTVEAALAARIKAKKSSPGSEAGLRHQLEMIGKGGFDYAGFSPELAALVRSQASYATQRFAALGAFKSLKFNSVAPGGFDIYDAVFERGAITCWIWPLVDGKIKGLRYLPPPQDR